MGLERDYSLEFSGGVVALMQGDTEIALELDQRTTMVRPLNHLLGMLTCLRHLMLVKSILITSTLNLVIS